MNQEYEGQVTGVETTGHVRTIVYCSDAPAGLQWHILSPIETLNAQVGARVRLNYVSTRSYGRWQVVEILRPTPQPEHFRGSFVVEVAANVQHFIKSYEDRRDYARQAMQSAEIVIDAVSFPGVLVKDVQVED